MPDLWIIDVDPSEYLERRDHSALFLGLCLVTLLYDRLDTLEGEFHLSCDLV